MTSGRGFSVHNAIHLQELAIDPRQNAWKGVCYGPKIAVFLEILASASVLGLNKDQLHCSQRLV